MKQSFFARYAWLTILALVGLLPVIFWGVKETFRNSNNNVSQWLPQDYEETRTYQEFRRLFGSDDFAVISWEGCTLDDDRVEALAGYLVPAPEERRPGDGSEWFQKVITGQQVLDDLMTGPAQLSREAAVRRLQGTLVGPDLETTCAVVLLSEKGDADRTGALDMLQEIAAKRCGLSRDQLRLGGDAVINAAIDIESKQAIRKWVGLAWGLAIAMAWLSLRRARLMLMVFAVSFYAAILGTGLVHYTGGTMNLLLVLVPVLLFVLTISASVHLCNYYRDAIHEFGVVGAPLRAMQSGWTPCALSAATTALGLASLLVSHISPVKSFGFYSSTGMLLSLGLLFLLLPTLMEKWPLKGPSETARSGHSAVERRDRVLRRVAGAIIRYNGPIAVSCLAVLITLGCGVAFLKTAIQPARFFPEDSKWIQDGEWFGKNVGPLVTVEVVLGFDKESAPSMRAQMQLVHDVERQVHAMEEVGGTMSAATFAPNLNPSRAVRRATIDVLLERNREFFVDQGYLNETGQEERWRITARLYGGRDVYYDQILASIRERVDRFLEERATSGKSVTPVYTGSAPLVFAAQQELLRGLMRSFCLAFALIAVVMVCLLRSIWAGSLAMLPNVFPALVTFGCMGWIARPVDVGAMMTASVALGIAVDDTLHFLTWFRRGRLRGETRAEAIIEAYQRCAPAMTQTTLITGPALLVFYLSSFQPVSQFGLLMFILLAAALVGDLIFLPALLATRFGESFFRNSGSSGCLRPDGPG
ncbi:MAG: MMPL family transporter [Planctomycetes bacterium]|nr:MMPL family transporter [Planctomycetota bacterium]